MPWSTNQPILSLNPGSSKLPPLSYSLSVVFLSSRPCGRSVLLAHTLVMSMNTWGNLSAARFTMPILVRWLLWYFDGWTCNWFPIQCLWKSNVHWFHSQLLGYCSLARQPRWFAANCYRLCCVSDCIDVWRVSACNRPNYNSTDCSPVSPFTAMIYEQKSKKE